MTSTTTEIDNGQGLDTTLRLSAAQANRMLTVSILVAADCGLHDSVEIT